MSNETKRNVFKDVVNTLHVMDGAPDDYCKELLDHYRLSEIFTEWDWNYDEQELIARAWLDGYEVVKVE